jgi:hypothetical protein
LNDRAGFGGAISLCESGRAHHAHIANEDETERNLAPWVLARRFALSPYADRGNQREGRSRQRSPAGGAFPLNVTVR